MGQKCDTCDKCQDLSTCETEDAFCARKKKRDVINFWRELNNTAAKHKAQYHHLVSVYNDIAAEDITLTENREELLNELQDQTDKENFWNFAKKHHNCIDHVKTCTLNEEETQNISSGHIANIAVLNNVQRAVAKEYQKCVEKNSEAKQCDELEQEKKQLCIREAWQKRQNLDTYDTACYNTAIQSTKDMFPSLEGTNCRLDLSGNHELIQ